MVLDMSPLIPARCRGCGLTWQPNAIMVENSTNTTISGSRVNCPNCGTWADLLEGTFDVQNGAVAMKSGPQWSWDLVGQLGLALKVAVDARIDPVPLVAAVDASVGQELAKATSGMSLDRVLTIVSLLYSALATDYAQVGENLNGFRDTIAALIRYIVEHGRLPGAS